MHSIVSHCMRGFLVWQLLITLPHGQPHVHVWRIYLHFWSVNAVSVVAEDSSHITVQCAKPVTVALVFLLVLVCCDTAQAKALCPWWAVLCCLPLVSCNLLSVPGELCFVVCPWWIYFVVCPFWAVLCCLPLVTPAWLKFQPHLGLLETSRHPALVLTMWPWSGSHLPQMVEPRSPATVWRSARRPAKSGSRWRTSSRLTLSTRSPVWRRGWDTTSPSLPRTRLAMENPVRLKLLSNPRSQKVGIIVFPVKGRVFSFFDFRN